MATEAFCRDSKLTAAQATTVVQVAQQLALVLIAPTSLRHLAVASELRDAYNNAAAVLDFWVTQPDRARDLLCRTLPVLDAAISAPGLYDWDPLWHGPVVAAAARYKAVIAEIVGARSRRFWKIAAASMALGVVVGVGWVRYRRRGLSGPSSGKKVPLPPLDQAVLEGLGIAAPRHGWPHYFRKVYGAQALQRAIAALGKLPAADRAVKVRELRQEFEEKRTTALKNLYACTLEPARKIKKRLGINKLPAHVAKFGEFMLYQAGRDLGPVDVVKAYLVTISSIQRRAQTSEGLRKYWPTHPFEGLIRPEDVMARLLGTPEGLVYMRAAADGRLDHSAAETLQGRMAGFGLSAQLWRGLEFAPALAARTREVVRLLKRAPRRAWLKYVRDHVMGVGYAKAGFLAALLGRGDIATADVRQLDLWAPGVKFERGVDLVFIKELNRRLQALAIDTPAEFRPYYEHLAHHAVWDRVGETQTFHDEIIKCMTLGAA